MWKTWVGNLQDVEADGARTSSRDRGAGQCASGEPKSVCKPNATVVALAMMAVVVVTMVMVGETTGNGVPGFPETIKNNGVVVKSVTRKPTEWDAEGSIRQT